MKKIVALLPLFLLAGCDLIPHLPKKEEAKPLFEDQKHVDPRDIPNPEKAAQHEPRANA